MTDTHTTPSTSTTDLTPQEALERMRDELAAMPEQDIIRKPGFEPATATKIAFGSLARIAKHRGEIAAAFGDAGTRHVDALPVVTLAAMQAESDFNASDSMANLTEKFEKIAKDHALLLTDADALVNRGLLERARVDQGRACQGYDTTLKSIGVLLSIFRERFAAIRGSTPVTLEELKRIEKDALAMGQLIAERELGVTRMPAAEMRARAISQLIRTYGEVRRYLTFVRWWSEDADQIAPSLWSGRRGKGRGGSADEPTDVEPGAPAVGPNDGGPFTS